MLRLLGSFWWRNKERFIILLIGVFIVSSGLSFLSGITESNKGTVMETLQNKWQVSYHILVRPPGTSLTDEQNNLIEPNLPGGISGGITTKQLQQIKQIPEVDVAAPLAVIGYSSFGLELDGQTIIKDYGVYRFKNLITANNGVQNQTTETMSYYLTYGLWQSEDSFQQYGVFNSSDMGNTINHAIEYSGLLVGIDPVEENKLVGLKQALQALPNGDNRYFNAEDSAQIENLNYNLNNNMNYNYKLVDLPILVSSNVLEANTTYSLEFDRLDLPFATAEEAKSTMKEVKANGGGAYLDKIPVDSRQSYKYTTEQIQPELIESLSDQGMQLQGVREFQQSTPLTFKAVTSPYADRWPNAYQLQTFEPSAVTLINSFPEFYRPLVKLRDPQNPDTVGQFMLRPKYIGMYDPTKLHITKDIDNLFPMDTYSTPAVKSVLDQEGHPVNPPVAVSSIHNPLGFMTSPPTMLTTLDAATLLMGDKPISVIRVKVEGVDEVTEANRQKLERVAAAIREQTGLLADVTFASSPQPVLIQVPPSGTQTALGWIEQQWIKLGVTFTLVNEVKVGFTGMLMLVMLVAVIYVVTTNLISFLVRKKRFALLLSIGWRYSQINKLILIEATLIGLFVALVTWSIEAYFIFHSSREISLEQFFAMGGFGFLIYLLGAVAPLILVRRISPMDSLRSGEASAGARRITPVRNLFQLALAHFGGRIKRNSLSVLSMTIPATLMMFFVFVTLRLQGTFYTSWIGQYAAAEIGPMHYVALGICLLISVLTMAEIMWQNVAERGEEIALLKAVGWRSGAIRRLILWEGVIAGSLSGVISCILGIAFITVLYRQFPGNGLWVVLPVALIPLLAGIAGSIVPAEMAVALGPQKGLAGKASTSRVKGNLLKTGLAVTVLLMLFITATSVQHIMRPHIPEISGNVETAMKDISKDTPDTDLQNIGDLSGFTPHFIQNGNKAVYDLKLLMNEQGQFHTKAAIKITNTSADKWDRLVFYMIPNVFTQPYDSDIYHKDAAFSIQKIMVNGQSLPYTLDWDTLSIPLPQGLEPSAQTDVEVTYDFTVPEKGQRFSRTGQSYDLAQWYPMLATYVDGWNKEPYTLGAETFITDFSDFSLEYQLPAGYRVISSSDEDPRGADSSGRLKAEHVKELMVSFTKDLTPLRKIVDNVEISIWSAPEDKDQLQSLLSEAADALAFFNKNIGPYPHKKLDIILGDRQSMEYPGIVTVFLSGEPKDTYHTIVHEIAHQWFYGVINNDQYKEGWLDEGMTELSTSLFLNDFSFATNLLKSNGKPSNLPLSEIRLEDRTSSLYAQPTMKFKALFESHGDNGLEFLKAYYENFQFKQVDTLGFVEFVKAYYGMTDNSFFDGWIKIE